MKSVFAFLILGFCSAVVQAQTLVISDIDDTIKISHVLDLADNVLNGPEFENHFLGMSGLYQRILKADSGTQFAYVSNAWKPLKAPYHGFFLRFNQFPEGGLYLREKLSDQQFKITTIRDLIARSTPKKLILIGDNGQKDSLVYDQIKKEYPQLSILTFIHQVYSVHNRFQTGRPLSSGQIGFVTSVDLAEKLHKKNLIDSEDLESLIHNVLSELAKEDGNRGSGQMAFPVWLDCRDYFGVTKPKLVSNFPSFQGSMNVSQSSGDLLKEYHRLLKIRCSTHAVNR